MAVFFYSYTNCICCLEFHFHDELANLALAYHRCMRILRPDYHELTGTKLYVSGCRLGVKSAVCFCVVGLCEVGAVFYRLPAYCLLTLKEDVDVNILMVHLEHLMLCRYTFRIDVIDEQSVAVKLYAATRFVEKVMTLNIVEDGLEQRVERLDAGALSEI